MIYFKLVILLSLATLWYWVVESKITDYKINKRLSEQEHSKSRYPRPLLQALQTHPIDVTLFLIINLLLVGIYTQL